MGTSEDDLNDKAGPAQNPINDKAGATEDPVNEKSTGGEKPRNDQAGGVENPVNDQASDAENPINDQAGGTENIVNNKASAAEEPVNNKVAGLENPRNKQSSGAKNPVNDHEHVADSPANDQLGAENAVIDKAGPAENPVFDQATIANNPVNDQAGGPENLVNEKAGATENVINEAGATEDPINDKASGIENPLNKEAGDAQITLNVKDGAAETAVEHKKVAAENSVVEADVVGNPVEDKPCAVENPVKESVAVDNYANNKADRLPEEAKDMLKSLASKWEDVLDANDLQVIPLKGAMTNEVFQIKWPTMTGETSRKVIVRIYGEGVDVFFDRNDEIQTFECMSKNGQGPLLLGRFANGRIEEFIHARTLSASDLRDPSIAALIAAKMKEFHDLDMAGAKKAYLWDRLRNWLSEAKQVSSPQEVEAFYLDTIDKEISILEKELSDPHQHIGFCHNDLQYGNIMLDEETNSVTIIDYEYASYNPVAYDIANHFCEMAANYHTETPHILDYSKYPELEERKRFVRAYLSSSGEQPSDDQVEQLIQEVEKYTLANHLFWGLWGIISAQVNTIDFNYKEYARQRFQEYWSRKPYLLITDAPSPYNMPDGEHASTSTAKGKHNIFRKLKRVMGLGLFKSKS